MSDLGQILDEGIEDLEARAVCFGNEHSKEAAKDIARLAGCGTGSGLPPCIDTIQGGGDDMTLVGPHALAEILRVIAGKLQEVGASSEEDLRGAAQGFTRSDSVGCSTVFAAGMLTAFSHEWKMTGRNRAGLIKFIEGLERRRRDDPKLAVGTAADLISDLRRETLTLLKVIENYAVVIDQKTTVLSRYQARFEILEQLLSVAGFGENLDDHLLEDGEEVRLLEELRPNIGGLDLAFPFWQRFALSNPEPGAEHQQFESDQSSLEGK